MDSILTSIKKLLGISEDDTQFDIDVIMHINSVFSILAQLGVGPSGGFSISDSSAVWTDFVSEKNVEFVKSYMFMKVRLMFDPPQSSSVIESMNRQISELEWRINVAVDKEEEENQNG